MRQDSKKLMKKLIGTGEKTIITKHDSNKSKNKLESWAIYKNKLLLSLKKMKC